MSAVIRSEVVKLRTVRTLLWIALANAGLILVTAGTLSTSEVLESADEHRSAAQIAATALILALIAGIIVSAGEATHGTITQTLLVTPRRDRVLLAKAVVAALVGFGLALFSELLVLAVLVPGASLDIGEARLVLAGILIAAPLAAALGVGFGAIFHGQGAAITVSLLWLLLGETLVVPASAEKYTPARAFAALVSGDTTGDELLGAAAGGLAAALWTAVLLAAGMLALLGRDV